MMKLRISKLREWTQWAKELEPAEVSLRQSMCPTVRSVLGNKRLKLLEKVANSFDWPDKGLFKEMAEFFKLTGYMQNTGVFSHDVKTATLAEEDFWASARMRDALWDETSRQSLSGTSLVRRPIPMARHGYKARLTGQALIPCLIADGRHAGDVLYGKTHGVRLTIFLNAMSTCALDVLRKSIFMRWTSRVGCACLSLTLSALDPTAGSSWNSAWEKY